MPLTNHVLKIDQRHEGWGRRALVDGVALLREQGLPAMAAELKQQAKNTLDPQGLLGSYLRLEVVIGDAAPSDSGPRAAKELAQMRQALGMTDEEMRDLFGLPKQTYEKIQRGRLPLPQELRKEMLDLCNQMLGGRGR